MSDDAEVPFRRHPISWTPAKVTRFWEWLSSAQPDEEYFARMHGPEVMRFAKRNGVLRGPAVDFGCGPGFLLEQLIAAGVPTVGVDLSRESLDRVQQRLEGRPNFLGVEHASSIPTSLEGGRFNLAFVLETVEHLDDEQLAASLLEVHRLLRPGGSLVVTTPNEEQMQRRMVMCPDCGCEFHRVQHVRSFSVASLSAAVERAGFSVRATETRSLVGSALRNRAREFVHRKVRRKPGANLLLIASKPG